MNGILNILKPTDMTSFDVVGYLRSVLKIKKIGHTGTLDPGAVGVLPVCVGKATKAIEFMIDKDKVYRAELTLGVSTDTQDATGNIISESAVNVSNIDIEDAVRSFVGKYSQVPPMYSALKVNGKKLYELARSGIEIERKPREVHIYYINILNIKGNKVIFDVGCSKGTYIRTLCSDIGDKLGCGGHMSFLVRTKVGIFDIDTALTLEEVSELSKSNALESRLISIGEVFINYKKTVISDREKTRLINGGALELKDMSYEEFENIQIYGENGDFLALGEVKAYNNTLFIKSKKLFV